MMRPLKNPNVQRTLPDSPEPCVWMTAGLLTYKLCDRDFDCAHCPLDAALCGSGSDAPPITRGTPTYGPWEFPDTLRYGPGHVWVRREPDGRWFLGIDAFFARVLSAVVGVVPVARDTGVCVGDPVGDIETSVGPIPIRSPVAGRVDQINRLVTTDPDLVLRAPYAAGWLVSLRPQPREETVAYADLLAADSIAERARLDLQRFRRQVAMHLLTASAGDGIGPSLADGGQRLTDVAQMLGARRYRKLLLELLG